MSCLLFSLKQNILLSVWHRRNNSTGLAYYFLSKQQPHISEVFKEDAGMGLKASKKQTVHNNLQLQHQEHRHVIQCTAMHKGMKLACSLLGLSKKNKITQKSRDFKIKPHLQKLIMRLRWRRLCLSHHRLLRIYLPLLSWQVCLTEKQQQIKILPASTLAQAREKNHQGKILW